MFANPKIELSFAISYCQEMQVDPVYCLYKDCTDKTAVSQTKGIFAYAPKYLRSASAVKDNILQHSDIASASTVTVSVDTSVPLNQIPEVEVMLVRNTEGAARKAYVLLIDRLSAAVADGAFVDTLQEVSTFLNVGVEVYTAVAISISPEIFAVVYPEPTSVPTRIPPPENFDYIPIVIGSTGAVVILLLLYCLVYCCCWNFFCGKKKMSYKFDAKPSRVFAEPEEIFDVVPFDSDSDQYHENSQQEQEQEEKHREEKTVYPVQAVTQSQVKTGSTLSRFYPNSSRASLQPSKKPSNPTSTQLQPSKQSSSPRSTQLQPSMHLSSRSSKQFPSIQSSNRPSTPQQLDGAPSMLSPYPSIHIRPRPRQPTSSDEARDQLQHVLQSGDMSLLRRALEDVRIMTRQGTDTQQN